MSSRSETSLIDMKYAPRALQKMFIVAGILIILGAFNVYSSTYYMNMESGANPYSHILRHLVFLGVSSLLAFILSRVNYHVIKKGAFLWCLGTIGLLALVMVAGRTVNGATRWISLGPFHSSLRKLPKSPAWYGHRPIWPKRLTPAWACPFSDTCSCRWRDFSFPP